MEIKRIKNNTYYIDSNINIGLYTENGKDYVMIDTGLGGKMNKKLLEILWDNNINIVGVINTHSHRDHIGGNAAIQEKYNCIISAPAIENIFIEYPNTFSMYYYPTSPFKFFSKIQPAPSKVNLIIEDNVKSIKINDYEFGIIHLKGHSPNHIGVVTPDNVVFCGDIFLGIEELREIKMLFCYDITQDILSKKHLLTTNYDIYLPSHGKPLNDITTTIEQNIMCIDKFCNNLLSFLSKPLSLDEIMGKVITNYNINTDLIPYFISQTCIWGMLSYLENINKISLVVEDGILKYVQKNV